MSVPGPVLITGGSGFLGCRIASQLLADDPSIEIVLGDLFRHPRVESLIDHPRVRFVQGDLAERAHVDELLADRPQTVFHLASLVSGGAEKNFPAGLRANVHATMLLLEAIREAGHAPRVVFTSSIATFGGADLPDSIDDHTSQHPQNSYGVAKVLGEQLLNDYTRKGFLDARAVRLAAIVVRDEPNTAASGYASGLVREPLAGRPYVCPVTPETRLPIMSIDACVDTMIGLAALAPGALGDFCAVNGPNINPSAAEIVTAVEAVAAQRGMSIAPITFAPDPAVMAIVAAWPSEMRAKRAGQAGLQADADMQAIVSGYLTSLADSSSAV